MTLTAKLTKEIWLNCRLPLKHRYFHCRVATKDWHMGLLTFGEALGFGFFLL